MKTYFLKYVLLNCFHQDQKIRVIYIGQAAKVTEYDVKYLVILELSEKNLNIIMCLICIFSHSKNTL